MEPETSRARTDVGSSRPRLTFSSTARARWPSLSSLQQVVGQIPPLTAELDILIRELHAKRLSIQALQAELAVLDDQFGVLERSLAPVQSWSHQWDRMRHSFTETLRLSGATDSDQT